MNGKSHVDYCEHLDAPASSCAKCSRELHNAKRDNVLATVIGMTYGDAVKAIQESGYVARKTAIDGKPLLVTRDYRADRINLSLLSGKVVMAYVG